MHDSPQLENPWIVFGISYAGALSAWFQLKFPHIPWEPCKLRCCSSSFWFHSFWWTGSFTSYYQILTWMCSWYLIKLYILNGTDLRLKLYFRLQNLLVQLVAKHFKRLQHLWRKVSQKMLQQWSPCLVQNRFSLCIYFCAKFLSLLSIFLSCWCCSFFISSSFQLTGTSCIFSQMLQLLRYFISHSNIIP